MRENRSFKTSSVISRVATMAEPSPMGKRFGKSLTNDRFFVTQAKLADFLKQHRALSDPISNRTGSLTFGEAFKLHLQRLAEQVETKRRNRLQSAAGDRCSRHH